MNVPQACVLDPDGRVARAAGAVRAPGWDCFHTELWTTGGGPGIGELGVVTGAVGAAWAVLVAQRLLDAGCGLLISITPALPVGPTDPHLLLIDRAVRDEPVATRGRTPAGHSRLDPATASGLRGAFDRSPVPVRTGASWSTAAPHRVFAAAVATGGRPLPGGGVACVDTDAAALYTLGADRGATVVCLAHLDPATAVSGTDVAWGPGVSGEVALGAALAAVRALDERGAAAPAAHHAGRS